MSSKENEKGGKYRENIGKLFNVASSDLVEKVRKDCLIVDRNLPLHKQELKLREDLVFIENQLGPRNGSMGSKDIVYSGKLQNRENRNKTFAERDINWIEEVKENNKQIKENGKKELC